jgi:hypothetical protein
MAPLSLAHDDCLSPASGELLERLSAADWVSEAYLAGSAALALYLGHRPVQALDLMSSALRLDGQQRRDLLQSVLALDPGARVETARDGYLYLRSGQGVAIKLYHYPYPVIDPLQSFRGIDVASPLDLGLMKLGAIISRGGRRDFVDLYRLCRKLPLEEILERSDQKFGHVRDFPLQALKGLVDFSLIDGEPMPRLSEELFWEQVETWLREKVRHLGRERLRLSTEAGQEESEPSGLKRDSL